MMMKRTAPILAILTTVASLGVARAQTAGATEPGKARDIRELLERTGGARLARLTVEQMVARMRQDLQGAPAGFWDRFLAQVDADELVERIVPIYDRHFTHEEIKELVAFYRTPVGQKLVAKTPVLTHETTLEGYEWGRRLGDKAAAELKAQGRE